MCLSEQKRIRTESTLLRRYALPPRALNRLSLCTNGHSTDGRSAMTEDFYDLLEIPSDASQDDIKQAFRTQVREYHPDLNDDERARAQFTALKKAYDILGDPVERKAYDRLGHETYVAKRTKGLPSPDAWKSTSSRDSTSTGSSSSTSRSRSSSGSSSSSSSRSGSKAGSSANTNTSSTSSTNTSTNRTRSGRTTSSSGSRRRRSKRTQTAGSSSTAGAGGGGGGATQSSADRSRGDTGSGSGSGVARWWRNQNFAWPRIWTATLVYIAGLLQYVLTHTTQLESLLADLSTVGGDPTELWQTLTTSRHGLESMATFGTTATPVSPQLPLEQWYAALAGVVGLAVLVMIGARVAWRAETWGRLSTDELILLAVAIAISTTLIGGPLLAGTVLMPLLFGVIIHRTRQLPGWAPSPLYAIAVCMPAVGLAVGASAVAVLSIPVEFVLFVLLPLAGSVGLLCRVQIRKRFSR